MRDKEPSHSIISRRARLSCQHPCSRLWTGKFLIFTRTAIRSENNCYSIIVSATRRVRYFCALIPKLNSSITAANERDSVVVMVPMPRFGTCRLLSLKALIFLANFSHYFFDFCSWSRGWDPTSGKYFELLGTIKNGTFSHHVSLADEWRKKSLGELAKEPGRGLAFEVYALRDIQPGTCFYTCC